MFSKTLDSKGRYTVGDGIEVVDLADTIFNPNVSAKHLYSIYKISKEYDMRPDLVSMALYGTTDYTEMVLKYSMINNPFAIEAGDMVFASSLTSIYNAVKDVEYEKTVMFDAIKNYHKYIDKKKVPDSPGSDKVKDKSSYDPNAGYNGSNGNGNGNGSNENGNGLNNNGPVEANITKTGNSGITIKDGKIYFGAVEDSVSSVDSSIVDCAVSGVTLGEFLNATLRNSQ